MFGRKKCLVCRRRKKESSLSFVKNIRCCAECKLQRSKKIQEMIEAEEQVRAMLPENMANALVGRKPRGGS